jgi:hypothetical protein
MSKYTHFTKLKHFIFLNGGSKIFGEPAAVIKGLFGSEGIL